MLVADTTHTAPGGTIRTISVSLLAVAAVTLSVFFARTRQTQNVEQVKEDDAIEGGFSLDQVRAAGF